MKRQSKKHALKYFVIVAMVGLLLGANQIEAQDKKVNGDEMKPNIYAYSVLDNKKEKVDLKNYEGKVLLIVNVASKCGYTKQYKGLEKIYRKYKSKGFEILAFPCNDFGKQEPGTNDEIQYFCSTNFDVTFQLFDKISVKGEDKLDLYKLLTDNSVTGKSEISWNFEKFLIDKEGNIIKHYLSKITPEGEEITSKIEELLNNSVN
jgi:glutathione peroxidase